MFQKFLIISCLYTTIVFGENVNKTLEDEKILVEDYSKIKQVSNHMLHRIQRDQSNLRQLSWPSFRSKFSEYDYEDDQKFGPFVSSQEGEQPSPPAPPPFDQLGDDEHLHHNVVESAEPPAPPDFGAVGNDENSQKASRIESVAIREFCSSGQEHIQLGQCSATFVRCMDFATNYEYKDSPLESVFVQDTFRKAIEIPECFDSEINRLNEATEKLAISVNFCDQGPGVYRASLQQSGGECSRQALLCDKHREPLSISCASNQVLDSHTLKCIPAPDHCVFVPNGIYAPIREFLMEIYCTFKPVKFLETDSNMAPFTSSTAGHGPLPVCDDWFVTCSADLLEFGFCENGKIFDEHRQLCRAMGPEDKCSNIGACRGAEWQKVAFGECRQEFGYCEGPRPRIFTCQDQHIYHGGNCVKPWETNSQCATCKPDEKRRAPNCHQYYQCAGDVQATWSLQTCPQGHYFEAANHSCTISDGRCASVSECRDGDSYSPTCGDYILCVGGKFMLGNCPHLTRWDGRQRRCVEDSSCKRYLETHCRRGDVIPSYDCKTYQLCQNGRFVKEQCFNGKNFLEPCRECENKFLSCHSRYESQNYKPLTCVHGEKIIDSKDCKRYVECIQGEWYSMECRQGSFDQQTKSCNKNKDDQCGYAQLNQPKPPQSQTQYHQAIYLPADNQNILQDFRVESVHSMPIIPQNYSSNYAQTDFLYEKCDANSPVYVPHPYDCSKYKKCDQTRGYYIETKCNENEQFDWKQGECRRWFQCKAPSCVEGMRLPKDECGKAKRCRNGVWEDVRCKNEMAFINGRCSQTVSCKNASPTNSYGHSNARCFHGDTKPHPKYCSRFYLCSYGEFLEVECLNGQKYSPNSKRCDPQFNCPSEYQPNCYHGDTKPVENKCDQYHSCIDGEYQLKYCPLGKIFNEEQRRCETGTCRYNQGGETDIQNESCNESPLPSGYRVHPTDCNRFYQCAHGKWAPKTCPANLAFNAALAVCDWPSNVPGCTKN